MVVHDGLAICLKCRQGCYVKGLRVGKSAVALLKRDIECRWTNVFV